MNMRDDSALNFRVSHTNLDYIGNMFKEDSEEVWMTATNRRNAVKRAEADAKYSICMVPTRIRKMLGRGWGEWTAH